MSDTIERQAAIDALGDEPEVWYDGEDELAERDQWRRDVAAIKALPSVQPERLTDDDFETIRIHLNAYKEKLCNQKRWKDADEYQRIIDRFMAFASVQQSRLERAVAGKSPEEIYDFLYWLMFDHARAYTDSRAAVIAWLKGESDG